MEFALDKKLCSRMFLKELSHGLAVKDSAMTGETQMPRIAGRAIFGPLAMLLLAGLLAAALAFWQTRRVQLSSFRSRFANDAAARSALIRQKTDELLLAIQSLSW